MGNSIIQVTQLLAAAEEHAKEGHAEGAGHHAMSMLGLGFYLVLSLVIMFGLMAYAKGHLNNRILKDPITSAFEQLYLFVENLAVGIIGSHGRKYIPMVMTLWMVIFVGNILALFFSSSTTADISFNLGLALIAMGYVQYEGIRSNGFFGHFGHFAGPKMGLALLPINLMLFVIEIISESMKNVSLTLRLYGNIDGGHRASDAMNKLGENIIGGILSVPFGSFLMPIKLLTCVVQALIFCLLFCVYLSLVTHGDDHGHDHDGHGDPAHAH